MSTMDMMMQMEVTFADFNASLRLAEASQEKWDRDFLALAEFWANRKSKDPSTKCGAVITRGREFVCLGYNGFAMYVDDSPERYLNRDLKYATVCHAEENAIVFAKRDLSGCTLYTWPFMPCSKCSGLVINAGISRCVAPVTPEDKKARWADSMALATKQFEQAGVELVLLEL